jgi:hypothetical protein
MAKTGPMTRQRQISDIFQVAQSAHQILIFPSFLTDAGVCEAREGGKRGSGLPHKTVGRESGTELSPDREDVSLHNQEGQRQLVKHERNEKFMRPGREQKCLSR